MHGYWKSFSRAARPLQLICDLDRPLQVLAGKTYLTPCPSCGNQMQILDSGFFCPNQGCFFRAGSPIDYLRASVPTYEEALQQFRNMYGEAVRRACGAESWESIKAEFAKQAARQRRLFNYFLKLRQRNKPEPIGMVMLHSWLCKNGIDMESCSCSAFLADKEDLHGLRRLIAECGADDTIPDTVENVVLFPYFGNHHTIAEITVYDRASDKNYAVKIDPYRFVFSGLLEPGEGLQVQLCHNHIDAAVLNGRYRSFQLGKICYSVLCNPEEQEIGFMPESPVYMHKQDSKTEKESLRKIRISMIAALAAHYPKLEIAGHDFHDSPHPAPPVSWREFVVREFLALAEAEAGITAPVQTFLECARPSTAMLAEISRELRSRNLRRIAEELEAYSKAAVIFKDPKLTIHATTSGYTAIRKDSMRSAITNFTCEFDQNLVFPDSASVYHIGRMFFDGYEYPLIISSTDLDNPKQLESAARSSEMRFAGKKPSNLVPAVPDRKNAQHLIAHFRGSVCHLPRIEGTPFLGWDIHRRNFYGASWHVSENALESRASLMHPDLPNLGHFSAEELPMIPVTADLPDVICDVISQAAAMMARSYLHHPVQPIKFINSPENRTVLGAIFAGLGQQSVIPMAFNGRISGSELPGLSGFPALTIGYNRSQTEKAELPVFMLLDTGCQFTETYDPDLLNRAAGVLRSVMARCAAWLLETQGKRFHRQASVLYDVAICREGEAMIREACNLPGWSTSETPYESIESALRQIPYDKVSDYFAHDLANQQVVFTFKKLKVEDEAALEKDLQEVCQKLEMLSGMAVMDAMSAIELLCNFYQSAPRLQSLRSEQIINELEELSTETTQGSDL